MQWLPAVLRRYVARRRFSTPRSFRYERFGGIAQLGGRTGWPQALVLVDRDRARDLGHQAPPAGLWDGGEELDGLLSAPLEAHLQLTNRCSVGCAGCYTGASERGAPNEWGLEAWCKALDELAEAGVFHVALGGGESAELPWLEELLVHARERGIIPSLTTSGQYDDAVLSRLCGLAARGLFGQVNVSIDGVGSDYQLVRGLDGFARADAALVALRKAWPDVGINCVITRPSFAGLPTLFAHAKRRGASEIEILRFKPAGRGARDTVYQSLRCTDEQHRALLPTVLELSKRHRLRVRLDCSLAPMIAHHRPPPHLLRFLSIYGCAGGDLLIAARPSGQLAACSFFPAETEPVTALREAWRRDDGFAPFRSWQDAQEPCRSCDYLPLCRGGCRVVSAHVAGDARLPDPECPRVLDWVRQTNAATQNGDPMTQRAKKRLPVIG